MTDDRFVPCHRRVASFIVWKVRTKSRRQSRLVNDKARRAFLAERSRYEEVEEISVRDALAGRAEHAACPPCVCYQFITATHTGYFRIPACATARCSEEARRQWRGRRRWRGEIGWIGGGREGEYPKIWDVRDVRDAYAPLLYLFLSLFERIRAYSRNVSSLFLSIRIRPSRYFVAMFGCDFAHLTTTTGSSRTRTYTFARARAHTENGERRESARTVADAPRTLHGVLGIARSDRGRRSAAPTTKRSFLRRHRSVR